MMGIHARLLLDGALILLGLTAGCGKGSTEAPAPSAATRASERPSATIPVAASAPSASQPAARQPGVLLVDCNPGRFQRELPELTEAFNALPPGGTMEAELYGNFPGEFTEFMWVGELEIEAGLVAVKAPIVGEILYGSGGRISVSLRQRLRGPRSLVPDRKLSL